MIVEPALLACGSVSALAPSSVPRDDRVGTIHLTRYSFLGWHHLDGRDLNHIMTSTSEVASDGLAIPGLRRTLQKGIY